MNFESLANELILDVFEFLDCINLIRAFHGLNHRFNQLICSGIQRYYLDLRSISKHDFDRVYQQYLPSITNQIISLHLSEFFVSYSQDINQFIHLKSLSITFHSFIILKQIIFECRQLPYLTHLRIHTNNYQNLQENYRDLIDHIWNLPKLTHCHLDIKYSYGTWTIPISTISQSIRYLSTIHTSYNLDSLLHLLEHTPYLKRLDIGDFNEYQDVQLQTIFPSLTSFSMASCMSIESMQTLFQLIPNVCYLTVQLNGLQIDGFAWEHIFINYFKNIKCFRMKMAVQFSHSDDVEERIDELLDSFRSHFWMEEHQWFVRCDWYSMDTKITALLYTLPYAFKTFSYSECSQSKSTNPNHLDYSSYNRVEIFEHKQNKTHIFNNIIFLPIRCDNIRHLMIEFPINNHYCSFIPTLNRLLSFDVTLYQDSDYFQLQMLLDRASHLSILRFCHLNKFSMASFNIQSTTLRQLEFFQNSGYRLRYFNSTECTMLANSSLAIQCEVLIIDVENRNDIVQLIDAMPKLRMLSVHCRDSKPNRDESIDDFIQWLQNELSSNYTFTITRKGYTNIPLINLCIHREI